jgi:hypothetical protein
VNSDFKGEIRGIVLVSLFIIVVPLMFFPKDFGLKWHWSLYLLFALEVGWYILILFVMFPKASAPKVGLSNRLGKWIWYSSSGHVFFAFVLLPSVGDLPIYAGFPSSSFDVPICPKISF